MGNGESTRTAIVTGASRGIGRALAAALGSRRFNVTVNYFTSPDAAAETVALVQQAGGRAIAVQADVGRADERQRLVDDTVNAFGGIDVLINNAGMTHVGRFRDADVDVIRRVMDVNFFGAVNCTKAALPSLLERRGRIVVTSSLAGVAPLPTRSGYAASKHALHGFFESLRGEHARDGLRVTMVCPTYVRTGIGTAALGVDGRPAPPDARLGVRGEIEPEVAADAIFRGVVAGRRLILVPGQAVLAYLVSRLAPALYERIISRQVLGKE